MTPGSSFYRSLGSLHGAGVGWPEAFRSVDRSSPTCMGIAARLEGGDSLAESLGPFVDPVDHALIRAGEVSGALDETFERLAAWHEAEERDRAARRTAIAYPALVALVGSLLMPLPDLFQGHLLKALGWSLLILVPTAVFVWLTLRGDRVLRARQERASRGSGRGRVRSMPHWGPWRNLVDEADARALSALAACEDAGVPMDEAVRLAARAGPGGRVAEDLLERAVPRIAAGDDLAGAWQAVGDMGDRLSAAEYAGAFGQAAHAQADRLRFDVQQRRERTLSRLPVYLTLLLGGIVAFRLLSFYGSYFDQLNRLQ